MIKYFVFLITLFFSIEMHAQMQGNIWYFGDYAGLDFNSGAPIAITNGAMSTDEGCAAISDDTGHILFYSNGVSVWNRNHVVMPNGSGLLGDVSSTQSCIFVLQPGSTTIFYIFTVAQVGGPDGLCYSIVDLTLDGGLGDITSKNVQLHTPVCEKISAVKHANTSDVWVLSHEWNSDAFYAYRLTTTGITSPVISNVGSVHTGGTGCGNINCNAVGCMKISSKGTKSALAIRNMGIELFDFNNLTGVVSNPVTFPATWNPVCGVEFSPNNNILYITKVISSPSIYQFNLNAGSPSAIISSATLVGTSSASAIGHLQLGPDGKIYVGTRFASYVGVINNPDVLGTGCNYVDQGVYLNGKICRIGLPSFNQTYWLVGTKEESMLTAFSLYPNPSSDQVFIDLPSDNNDSQKLRIYNVIGSMVSETEFTNNTKIDISEFQAGVYIIEIENTKTHSISHQRFIKQ